MSLLRNLFLSWAYVVVLLICVHGLDHSKKLSDLNFGILKRVPKDKCEQFVNSGDVISVTYTGKLFKDGTQFDSNVGKSPFSVTVGAGEVIAGWDKGLLGMCLGEKRRLFIPSSMGYGKHGMPPKIPADADLVFDVELIKLEKIEQKVDL